MSTSRKLHIFVFPLMGHGHTIPMLRMGILFARQGIKVSILAPQQEESKLAASIAGSSDLGIQILTYRFPSEKVGLPESVSHMDDVVDSSHELVGKFFEAASFLHQPLEDLLREKKPDCLVADMFCPWSIDVASKFQIPTVICTLTSNFSSCGMECIRLHAPHKNVLSEDEPFKITNLPGNIEMTRGKLQTYVTTEGKRTEFRAEMRRAELKAFGVIINSFYELEPVYADFFRNELGRNSWLIGPLVDQREQKPDGHECLKWLDSMETSSVVYLCFGTTVRHRPSQLNQIATALHNSGLNFLWALRKSSNEGTREEDWLPEGFEEGIRGRGMIVRGWVPQQLILQHEAIGGFVTHCGWNSTMEAICAAVPMVTWPIVAEQFYNEKLVTEVLRIGVAVGASRWGEKCEVDIGSEEVERALRRVMDDEESKEMRGRIRELADLGGKAVDEGGSSNRSLKAFLDGLSSLKDSK